MSRPRAVVVVAYGGTDYLREALAPLGQERVVVVDNSSAPATRELVEALGHEYVDPGANLGFAGGVNAGLQHLGAAGHDGDVLLLNPDARIEPADLDRLQDRLLSEPDLAAVAPTIVDAEGHPQLTWFPLPSPRQMWRFALRLPQGPGVQDFLIGAALMLRAEAIAEVGGLDERYFLYGEEADWQRRAFDAGWRVAEATESRALHHGGMSSDDDGVRISRVIAGQETYVRRWYGARGSASFRAAGWLATAVRGRSSGWDAAALQSRCFRLGPRRVAPLPPAPRSLKVWHVLRSGADPRAVAELASAQAAAGHVVVVLADGPAPPGVEGLDWRPVRSATGLARALGDGSEQDVVHAHGDAATALVCALGGLHGTRVVASPGDAASATSRALAGVLGRRVDARVESPRALDPANGYRAVVSAGTRKRNIA